MSPILSLSPSQKLFFILPFLAVSAALGQPLNATSSTPSSGASTPANSTTSAPVLASNLSNSNKTDLLHTGESKPEAYLVHLKPKKRSRNKSATNAKNKYLLLLRLPEDQTDHTAAGSSVDQQQRSVDDFSLNDDQQQQQQSSGGGFSDAIQVQDNGDDSDQQQQDQQSNNLSGGQEEDQGFDDISQFARNKPDSSSFGQRTSAPSNDYNQPQQQPQQQQEQAPVEQNNNNDQFEDSFSPNNQQQNDQPTYFSPIKSTKQINRAPASYVGPGSSKGGNTVNYQTQIQHDMPVQQQQQPQPQQQQEDYSGPSNQQQDDFSAPVNQQNNDYEGRRTFSSFKFFFIP